MSFVDLPAVNQPFLAAPIASCATITATTSTSQGPPNLSFSTTASTSAGGLLYSSLPTVPILAVNNSHISAAMDKALQNVKESDPNSFTAQAMRVLTNTLTSTANVFTQKFDALATDSKDFQNEARRRVTKEVVTRLHNLDKFNARSAWCGFDSECSQKWPQAQSSQDCWVTRWRSRLLAGDRNKKMLLLRLAEKLGPPSIQITSRQTRFGNTAPVPDACQPDVLLRNAAISPSAGPRTEGVFVTAKYPKVHYIIMLQLREVSATRLRDLFPLAAGLARVFEMLTKRW